ncbi:MAG: PIN domain nuclease [Steroidobacteraceae bacterium]
MLVVDTSVWVDHFNVHASPQAVALAEAIDSAAEIVLPGIVLTEILLGLRTDGEADRIERLLAAFTAPPPLSRSDYLAAARTYRGCRAAGRTIRSVVDCLIAQLCLRQQYVLLSKDHDFEAIARTFPLRLATCRVRPTPAPPRNN